MQALNQMINYQSTVSIRFDSIRFGCHANWQYDSVNIKKLLYQVNITVVRLGDLSDFSSEQ